ncbi:MAG: acyl-CoA dehydrogenase family protein [Chloroflexi bacterium]|nr:acyl-CoA dehydrogenase family protein [Chloroflexota bacterium]MDA1241254.1 acyl-CoA dehydrogenase family protein [Chloroflexota bacterium]
MVDFADSPEQAVFRHEVEDFFAKNFPAALSVSENDDPRTAEEAGEGAEADARRDARRQWRTALVGKGWIAPAWPKKYGGAELSPMEQFILNETIAERGAPRMGVPDVGSTIMVHGTEEQKAEFLPPMVRGETRWCQGYSEPGSGSDLASLQTRAVRDGDDFVINGQKIWTSGAHLANMIFALVRTDPEAPKHRGITYLLFPMTTPGIEVRPLVQMSDASGFNETFFEDVRVPVKNAVGEINRGWYVGATHLDFERSSIGSAVGQMRMLDTLREFLTKQRETGTGQSRLGQQDSPRLEIADRYIEASVAKTLSQRVISMQARGLIPNHEASMTKVFSTEFNQRIARTATKALGLYGGVRGGQAPQYVPMGGRWGTMYLSSVSSTIAGGTSEIQRNVIATRGLGLPRG